MKATLDDPELNATMAPVQQIILFGDQTEDFASLRRLLSPSLDSLLDAFLNDALEGLRTEINSLVLQDRQQYPHFPTDLGEEGGGRP